MTLGRFRINWWRQEIPGLTCTADQRESVLPLSLAFTDNYFLNEVRDANDTASSGIVRLSFTYGACIVIGALEPLPAMRRLR